MSVEIGKWYLWSVSDAERRLGRLDAKAGNHLWISGRCDAPYYLHGIWDARKIHATHEVPAPEPSQNDMEWVPRAFAEAREMLPPHNVKWVTIGRQPGPPPP